MKKKILFMAIGGLAPLAAIPAGAGGELGLMEATPDPAYVGDIVTLGNAPGDANTCEPVDLASQVAPAGVELLSVVDVEVTDPDGETVFDDDVFADADGNWSVEIPAEKVGTYMADAHCDFPLLPAGEAGPQRFPDFAYADIEWEVIAQPPASPTTQASTTTSSQAVRAEALSRPRFTG